MSEHRAQAPHDAPDWATAPPAWTRDLSDAAVLTRAVPDVRELSADRLRAAVADLYARALADAARAGLPRVVRVWHALPGINDPLGDGSRYMAFNAGRHDALRAAFGDDLPMRVPAASCVGHDGGALVVHFLACDDPSGHVENPRQVPAYFYSRQYGPLPPCFARAVRWRNRLLVSGTAAIVGERTAHPSDLAAQLKVMATNVWTILGAGGAVATTIELQHVRAYVARHEDMASVEQHCRVMYEAYELVRADLCRPDLLVEIEGDAPLFRKGHDD